MPTPNRGEVWLVDLGLAAKVRPCVVFSIPAELEDRALVTIVPHSTTLRGSKFEVTVNARFLRAGAFVTQNLVTVPEAKLIRKLGSLTSKQLSEIEKSVKLWLGLKPATDDE